MGRISTILMSATAIVVTQFSAEAVAQGDADGMQRSDAAEANSSDNDRRLAPVLVTAQKREQDLQSVPVTVSAFTAESLDQMGLTDTAKLGEMIPGLELIRSNGEGSQVVIFLRGAGLNDTNSNNAGPVGVYSDDVYISSPALTAFQFFDTERVEVLRGPQGTLYGRNSTGGAVKFISNKPTDEFDFNAKATYGSFNTATLEAAVSGPFSESVRGRFAISEYYTEGWIDNLYNGEKAGKQDVFSYRGLLDIDASDNLNFLLNLHGAVVDNGPASWTHIGALSPVDYSVCDASDALSRQCVDYLGYSGPKDITKAAYDQTDGTTLDSVGGSLVAKWRAGDFDVTSVTAYDQVDRTLLEDSDNSPFGVVTSGYDVESETFSQELRVEGSGDDYDWLAGVYYLTEDMSQDQLIDLFREFRPYTGGLADPDGLVTGFPILFARTQNTQTIDTYAVFGQTTFQVRDNLNLTLGARYTNEERDFTNLTVLEEEETYGGPVVLYDEARSLENDAVSWRVALDYQISDDALLYGSVANGFKSGGFNGGFLSLVLEEAELQLTPFEPEYLTAYEIGLKSDLFSRKVRLNTALFLNQFDDVQVYTMVNTDTLPIMVLDNASDAEVYGLEFDATLLLTSELTATLSGAFMHSELKNFESSFDGADYSGNQIANTPDSSLTGMLRYQKDLSSGANWAAQASVAYKSRVYFSTENNPIVSQDGYALTNLRFEYGSASGNWSAALVANNILDEEYRTFSVDLSDLGLYENLYGLPRNFSVEVKFDF